MSHGTHAPTTGTRAGTGAGTDTGTTVPEAPVTTPTRPSTVRVARGGIGQSVARPDGVPKVRGEFAYSSDLNAEGMLHGATVRSPHPRALVVSIDASRALAVEGVRCVLTHADVPGAKTYGLDVADQPVLAIDQVRFHGEPVALVAAEDARTARAAAALVQVEYEVLEPLVDAEEAIADGAPRLHEGGNVTRHVRIRRGDPDVAAEVVVSGRYEVGMQDQAFLGPESGLAIPDGDGGVDLYISTQWLHVDRDQLASVLDLPAEKVRLTLAGVGGAFGAREDLSMQAHCCMLALRTGRPVRMSYSREESFFGHVHRHPAVLEYEHGATRDGRLVFVRCRMVLDGGAYASSSLAVAGNAACFSIGPYEVDNVSVDAIAAYTNNPPCGAMRGFGAVQAAVAYEAQMDRLADELGMDPIDLRIANAMREGSLLPTGQRVVGPAPVRELLEAVRDMPTTAGAGGEGRVPDPRSLPGGTGCTTRGEGVRRGVGYGVGFKNVCYAEGFDDHSTARVTLSLDASGEPLVCVHTAGAEVGQGLVTVQMQIARTELGIDQVVLAPADTSVGSAGSSSASRQTYMTGGAVKVACEAVRDHALELAAARLGTTADRLVWEAGTIRVAGHGGNGGATAAVGDGAHAGPGRAVDVADLIAAHGVIEQVREFHHRETFPLDADGQGDAHVQLAFCAHRAIADVDVELGLVRVVELAAAQDVGRAMNPLALEGQIEGGTVQGLGLALMEEIKVTGGRVRNPSFTDYLIPTIADVPPISVKVFEFADPEAPYGLRGVGEPPAISSTPAVAAAVRAACGRNLVRVPIRPDDIVGLG